MKPTCIILLALLLAVPGLAGNDQQNIQLAAMQSPAVANCLVVIDPVHIGVTLKLNPTATGYTINQAMYNILQVYADELSEHPDYNGYLRIGIVAAYSKQVSMLYEATASETRSASNFYDLYSGMVDRGH